MRSTGRSGTNEDLSELTKNQVEMDRIRAEEEVVFGTITEMLEFQLEVFNHMKENDSTNLGPRVLEFVVFACSGSMYFSRSSIGFRARQFSSLMLYHQHVVLHGCPSGGLTIQTGAGMITL